MTFQHLTPWASAIFSVSLAAQPLMTQVAPSGAVESQTVDYDVTDPVEAARVDRVDVSGLVFAPCDGELSESGFECATLTVPMDYDEPDGEQMPLDIVRKPAQDQQNKRGTLFVNPGGPGGSTTEFLGRADTSMQPEVVAAFDLVGVEPRGVGKSRLVRCFDTAEEQDKVFEHVYMYMPQERRYIGRYLAYSRAYGNACSTHPNKMPYSMSSAQVARDMDVVRRALGEEKINYAGYSYGSILGQMYVNLFPDRVGKLMIEGVVYGGNWVGTKDTEHLNSDARIKGSDGAQRAMHQILELCDASPTVCVAAKKDDQGKTARQKYDLLMNRLAEGPLESTASSDGSSSGYQLTRNILADTLIYSLYSRKSAGERAAGALQDAWVGYLDDGATREERAAAVQRIQQLSAEPPVIQYTRHGSEAAASEATYWHDSDAFNAVWCGDGRHPRRLTDNFRQAQEAEAENPFAGVWAYQAAICARDTWKAKDDDRYLGEFNKKTSGTMLIIGNEWDPGTNVNQAREAAANHPHSSLIISDNWGHLASRTSSCIDEAISDYLIRGIVTPGKTCTGDYKPFTAPDDPENQAQSHENTADDPFADAVTGWVPPSWYVKSNR